MKLLHIDSSILGGFSASRQLSARAVAQLTEGNSGSEVIYRDLIANPPSHLTLATLPTAHQYAKPLDADDANGLAERAASDEILQEFLDADVIVIGTGMYNFTIPSQLKAWIDRIIVPGTTIKYTATGREGQCGAKRVIVTLARGSDYGPGSPAAVAEHAETYLLAALGYIGITDLTIIVAEGVSDQAKRQEIVDGAFAAIDQLNAERN